MDSISMSPVGVVRSAFKRPADAPHQGPEAGVRAVIELEPRFAQGLQGLRAGDHVWVLYHFHQADPPQMLVHPRGDPDRPLRGVFATRAPSRPCPIGLCLARLERIDGATLELRGLEAIDGTPVLDIKPYAPGLDSPRPEDRP